MNQEASFFMQRLALFFQNEECGTIKRKKQQKGWIA